MVCFSREVLNDIFFNFSFIFLKTRFIGAYFFGDNDDSKEFISIYLFCNNFPRNRSISLEYSICINNFKSKENSVTKGFY